MFSRRFKNVALMVTIGLILVVTGVVQAGHSWENYHWDGSSTPVTIGLGDNVDGTWQQWLIEASADWSVSEVLETPIVNGKARRGCAPRNGKAEVCNDFYGDNGWLGIAQIWINGDHITRSAAKMNDTYYSMPFYDNDGWRDMVMCQEIGHMFGLGHQDEGFELPNLGTCMDYTSDPDASPSNRAPNNHDYAQLVSIYTHLDGAAEEGGSKPCNPNSPKCSGAQTPPPAFDMELPNVGQWGRLVATSRDGGQSRFEQNFGNGLRVVTHVTWTLEVAEQLADEH